MYIPNSFVFAGIAAYCAFAYSSGSYSWVSIYQVRVQSCIWGKEGVLDLVVNLESGSIVLNNPANMTRFVMYTPQAPIGGPRRTNQNLIGGSLQIPSWIDH